MVGLRLPGRATAVAIAVLSLLAIGLAPRGAVASPDRIAVTDVYAEPGLGDDAGAVTLLVRAALDRPERAVVPLAELATAAGSDGERVVVDLDRIPEVATALGARWVVVGELVRDGAGVRAALIVLDRAGDVTARVEARAPDGALVELVTPLVEGIAQATGGLPANRTATVSVGQLRRFVRAIRAWRGHRDADAAAALDGADPTVALKVPATEEVAHALWQDPSLGADARLIAVLAAGTPRDVVELATGSSGRDRAARAMARMALSDAGAAEKELAGVPRGDARDPRVLRARAALAAMRRDASGRDALLRQLLPPDAATLLLWSRLPAGPHLDLERAALDAASRVAAADPRIAAAIGLRAADAGIDLARALALISVRELDDAEAVRLAPVVERALADGVPEAQRLRVELALRAGDLATGRAALDAWDRAGPDARAALIRGRLALADGDARAAAAAFERAGDPIERALALLAAGDPTAALAGLHGTTDSVVAHVVAAEVALDADRPADAVAELRAAALLSPGSAEIQRRLARALALTGDDAARGAAEARALVLDPSGKRPTTVVLATSNDGATAAAVTARATAVDDVAALAGVLEPMLAALPEADRLRHRKVVLVPLAGGGGWLSIREADAAPVRRALGAILEASPWLCDVVPARPGAQQEPLSRSKLSEVTSRYDADAVVLYRVVADGSRARITVGAWVTRTGEAHTMAQTIDGARYQLVSWNLRLFAVLGAVVAALVAFGLLWALRGRGVIEVHAELDPAATDEVMCVQIARGGTCPTIGDPAAWRDATRRTGQVVTRRSATLVPRTSRYRIGAGRWVVHLYGVFSRAGELRVLDAPSQTVLVKRGQTAIATFDLVPAAAELRISVHDESRGGVGLWIDEAHDKVYTNAAGEAVLFVPLGQHTLHIEARGLTLQRPLSIATPRLERLSINLIRERRLAEVSGGLSLQRTSLEGTEVELATPPPRVFAGADATPEPRAGGGAGGTDGAIDVDLSASAPAGAAPAATLPLSSAPAVAATLPVASASPASAASANAVAAASATAPPTRGTMLLDRYRIDDVLGEGAMGVVYRAWDHNLERAVAIKALGAEVRRYEDALAFFRQEAKALAQLNHPNIVSVYDQTQQGDETYMIMELVEGRTLERVLAESGRLTLRSVARLIDQLCAGLAYAHARKVIHRDIKPANIFLGDDGVVKLGDFGLARVMREIAIRKTEIRGTPLYMAPEQITGTNVNHRVDLYAVGCTFFELLTGRPPFVDGDVMYHHLHTPPPAPSSFRPGLPAELDALILACLAKDVAERVATADVIREGLRRLPLG